MKWRLDKHKDSKNWNEKKMQIIHCFFFFFLYLKADLSTRNNFVHWPCSADRASIKVSYKDEMWARVIGCLFSINNLEEKTVLLTGKNLVSSPQALLKIQSIKRMFFYDGRLSRNVCFFKFNCSWISLCLHKEFRSPNKNFRLEVIPQEEKLLKNFF